MKKARMAATSKGKCVDSQSSIKSFFTTAVTEASESQQRGKSLANTSNEFYYASTSLHVVLTDYRRCHDLF